MIEELLKRPIAYNPIVAKAFGSVKLGILWSQIYYWTDKTKDPDGWIYKTQNEVFDETGLSRREQETARKIGEKLGVLESEVKGTPPKVNYRINIGKTIELIDEYIKENKQAIVKSKKGKGVRAITPGQFNKRFFEDLKSASKNSPFDGNSPVLEVKTWIADNKIVISKKDMQEFVLHWTEPNKSGNKEHWELEKTFDVKRRILKWLENKAKWGKSINNKKNITV